MSITIKQTDIPLWHYVCPDCGIGSQDTGYHAPTHMIYCEVCLEDARQVKLKRWPADPESSPPASGGPRRG